MQTASEVEIGHLCLSVLFTPEPVFLPVKLSLLMSSVEAIKSIGVIDEPSSIASGWTFPRLIPYAANSYRTEMP